MEGNQDDIVEVEPINGNKITMKNIKKFKEEMQIIFAIAVIIGLIIGSIIWFAILQPKPIYQQYEKHEGDYETTYENEELNVSIIESSKSDGTKGYYLEWTNIYGEEESHYASSRNLKTFMDNNVLLCAYRLSIDQIKWFEYMCKDVL